MKKILSLLFLLSGLILSNSCTNLDETILDETLSSNLSDQDAANGSLAPVYGKFTDIFTHTNYFALQEISSDEAILPYRGGTDWGDNGIYLSLHQHVTTSTDPNVRNTWGHILQGISRAVTAINVLPEIDVPASKVYLAEARGLNAYYGMLTLDLFGLVFVKDDPGTPSRILRGAEAVNYLINEFQSILNNLDNTVGPGRLTQYGAMGLLARLYLNAAVYRDIYGASFNFTAADMDKVIEYCDKIIASGQYKLSPNYFDIFGNNNHDNKELIFAHDQRADLNGHNRLAYFSLSGDQFPLPAFPNANGTDGPAITSDFYRTWVAAYGPDDPATKDPRFYQQNISIYTNPGDSCVAAADFKVDRGILRGQQYGLIRVNGAFVKCPDGRLKVGKLFSVTRNKPTLPVDFTETVNFTVEGGNYSNGYRVEKYEFSSKSASGRNFGEADIVLVRLADIYLMRAEAKLRKGGGEQAALADVNTVRAARTATKPAPPLNTMNLDLLYRERGFELYWEFLRRPDMIRFGKYEGIWTEKNNTDKNKRIFPIPQTAIDGASNLPGYLVQNQGY
ncbi:MAG: RagB/SusD family nutrient uptake outer membrane protein [Saprospiraceae bacterium]